MGVAQQGYAQQGFVGGQPITAAPGFGAPGAYPAQQGMGYPAQPGMMNSGYPAQPAMVPGSAAPIASGMNAGYGPQMLPPGAFNGTLIVKPEMGKFLKDLDLIGKMDPYCEISIGGQVYKTQVALNQGMNPVWSDSFSFKLNGEQFMNIRCLDQDVGRDDLIGETQIPLNDIISKRVYSGWYPVFAGKTAKNPAQPAGQIFLATEYIPVNALPGTGVNMPTNYIANVNRPANILQQSFGSYPRTHVGYVPQPVIPSGATMFQNTGAPLAVGPQGNYVSGVNTMQVPQQAFAPTAGISQPGLVTSQFPGAQQTYVNQSGLASTQWR